MWTRGVIDTPGQQIWFHMKGVVVGNFGAHRLGRTLHGLVSLAEIRPQEKSSLLTWGVYNSPDPYFSFQPPHYLPFF